MLPCLWWYVFYNYCLYNPSLAAVFSAPFSYFLLFKILFTNKDICTTVDSVGLRRQPGLHLESPVERNRAAAVRTHWHSPVHCLPPHREHYCLCCSWERQDYQALEEWYLSAIVSCYCQKTVTILAFSWLEFSSKRQMYPDVKYNVTWAVWYATYVLLTCYEHVTNIFDNWY